MRSNILENHFSSEAALDRRISRPSEQLVEIVSGLKGNFAVLGIAGKMGVNLGAMLVQALKKGGVKKTVYGISRFSDPGMMKAVERWGIRPVKCDLFDFGSVEKLPDADNVVFMAGRKFGTDTDPELTWALNTIVPSNICRRYSESRIVAFSTGCVYGFTRPGFESKESDTPAPVGDYAQSALGRERIFAYYAKTAGTKVSLVRLNYANDLRYGVIRDLIEKINKGEPVDLDNGYVNLVWQGDAIRYSLLAFNIVSSPASILNIAGPETVSVRCLAEKLGQILRKKPVFAGAEAEAAYLSNAGKSFRMFGYPEVPTENIIGWSAKWAMSGGRSLNKPTHFQTRNGSF
ncbi:MAG: NAD(P)-dependent oxidoreductase [Victivallales bacterium]|jgi:nucleoside-diphosphate-sugar epimerase